MRRREELFLRDVVTASREVSSIISARERAEIERNDVFRSAVIFKLIIIGEAAAQIPHDLRDRHPDVPWAKIVAFRNFAVHRYFDLSWRIVVDAAFDDVPTLCAQIEAILEAEFG